METWQLYALYFGTCNIVLGLLGVFLPSTLKKDETLTPKNLFGFVGGWLFVQILGGAAALFVFGISFANLLGPSFPSTLGCKVIYYLAEGYLGWALALQFGLLEGGLTKKQLVACWLKWVSGMLIFGGVIALVILLPMSR